MTQEYSKPRNNISQEDLKLLKAAISRIIRKQNPFHDTNPILTNEVIELMSCSLGDFILESTDKFIRGAIKHGGDIRDRNLKTELHEEFLDTFWYTSAQQWPTKNP